MGNCYSIHHIAEDYIHTDITCNIEEPKQKYHLGTVSNRFIVTEDYLRDISTKYCYQSPCNTYAVNAVFQFSQL